MGGGRYPMNGDQNVNYILKKKKKVYISVGFGRERDNVMCESNSFD